DAAEVGAGLGSTDELEPDEAALDLPERQRDVAEAGAGVAAENFPSVHGDEDRIGAGAPVGHAESDHGEPGRTWERELDPGGVATGGGGGDRHGDAGDLEARRGRWRLTDKGRPDVGGGEARIYTGGNGGGHGGAFERELGGLQAGGLGSHGDLARRGGGAKQ